MGLFWNTTVHYLIYYKATYQISTLILFHNNLSLQLPNLLTCGGRGEHQQETGFPDERSSVSVVMVTGRDSKYLRTLVNPNQV